MNRCVSNLWPIIAIFLFIAQSILPSLLDCSVYTFIDYEMSGLWIVVSMNCRVFVFDFYEFVFYKFIDYEMSCLWIVVSLCLISMIFLSMSLLSMSLLSMSVLSMSLL